MAWHVHPPGISSVHLTHVYRDGPKSGHVLQSNSQAVQGKNSHNLGTTFKPIYLGPLSRANKLIAKERMLPVPRVPLLCEKGRRLPREFRGGEWTGVRSVGRSVSVHSNFKLPRRRLYDDVYHVTDSDSVSKAGPEIYGGITHGQQEEF